MLDMVERLLETGVESNFDDKLLGGTVDAWRLVVTSLVCLVVTSLAVSAGIGGGGLLVPLYSLILGIDTRLAIPISEATILGVACGNVFFITPLRHPEANRPLIDYATVALMQPGELMGVVIGVFLNQLLPEVIVIILLVIVLGLTCYVTLKKGIARCKSESKACENEENNDTEQASQMDGESAIFYANDDKEEQKEGPEESANNDSNETEKPVVEKMKESEEVAANVSNDTEMPVAVLEASSEERERADALQHIEDKEAIQFPLRPIIFLVCMTACLTIYSLLLNQVIIPGFDNCDPAYWPLYWSPIVVFGCMQLYFAHRNVSRYKEKVDLGFKFVDGDVCWTRRVAALLAPTAVAAGTLAGLLGIGGGMILGPLFVTLNFHPLVSTASTGLMMIFTSFSSTVQYLAVGRLSWRYALWFGSIGAIGAQMGERVVKHLVHRTGRLSIVVILLGALIGAAVIIMAASGAARVAEDAKNGEDLWAVNKALLFCDE